MHKKQCNSNSPQCNSKCNQGKKSLNRKLNRSKLRHQEGEGKIHRTVVLVLEVATHRQAALALEVMPHNNETTKNNSNKLLHHRLHQSNNSNHTRILRRAHFRLVAVRLNQLEHKLRHKWTSHNNKCRSNNSNSSSSNNQQRQAVKLLNRRLIFLDSSRRSQIKSKLFSMKLTTTSTWAVWR